MPIIPTMHAVWTNSTADITLKQHVRLQAVIQLELSANTMQEG